MINRRDFLSTTALGSAGGLAAAGCATALPRAPTVPLTDAQGREIAARLDGAVAGLDHLRLVSSELGRDAIARSPRLARYAELADPMAKRAVQSLVVAAAAKEIPAGTEAPAVLRRAIDDKLPLLDQHVLETAALFKRLPLQERRRLARALAADPGAADRIATRIDRLGESVGVHPVGRESLHHAARTIVFRLTKQPPAAFFDEQVAKVERVASARGLDATVQRMMASHASTTAILQAFGDGDGGAGGGLATPQGPVVQVPAPPPVMIDPELSAQPEPDRQRGVVPAVIGGVLLGTGAILLGISIPAAFADGASVSPWLFVITGGGLMALAGVICLIIGAALGV